MQDPSKDWNDVALPAGEVEQQDLQTRAPVSPSRRGFMRLGAGSGVAMAAVLVGATRTDEAKADDFDPGDPDPSLGGDNRAEAAFVLKRQAARTLRDESLALPAQLDNDDETRYENERYYASFSKTLPCNARGEVNPSAFEALQQAMRSGAQADFDAIPLAGPADRVLANPQGAFKFGSASLDSHATRIAPAHPFRSAELAGEMVEVYWQALTRDVPFERYGDSGPIAAAAADLNALGATPGSSNGTVTPATIFRGETAGDLIGPYISQFLLQPFAFGPQQVEQRYAVPAPNLDFMVDEVNWLRIQRGAAPNEAAAFLNPRRYIHDNRTLADYVHRDVSFQAYLNAGLILLGLGPNALDAGNPYRVAGGNQGAFVSLGAPFILDLVTRAGNLALSGAWFQKWRVHRVLRPEALAARVHFHLQGAATYELHPDVLNSVALNRLNNQNATALLPLAYPEGSPTHPAYPAGHACIAGACVTVLKALFDETFVIPNPVRTNNNGNQLLSFSGPDLTVGGELNKLANNISIGRNAAGVHYRQDGTAGIRAGEQQAISMLREQSRTLNEANFGGFQLTTFDGQAITIANGEVS